MSTSRPLIARVRECFRPREADGGGWTYDPISQWATVTGHVVRTRGGVLGPEEVLERDMVLDIYIPVERMRYWLGDAPFARSITLENREARVPPTAQPRREAREDQRPTPQRIAESVSNRCRLIRHTPRKRFLERARLPRMAPPVTPVPSPETVRPALPVPYVASSGRFVRGSSDSSAGPSRHVDRGKRKVRDEPDRALFEVSEDEENPEETSSS